MALFGSSDDSKMDDAQDKMREAQEKLNETEVDEKAKQRIEEMRHSDDDMSDNDMM